MASDESPTPSGHRFNNISVSGGKAHLGDAHYHYTSEDPSKELEKKIDACRNELLLTDPLIDLETLKSSKGERTQGTCEWIRDNGSYKHWLHGDSQCLWICGGPGKGKTMLSIFLTEELERHTKEMESTETLYYFCSHQDKKRNSAVTVLRSLVYQLLTKRRDLFTSVSSYFESPEKTRMTLSSPDFLWVILRTLVQSKPGLIFCVLDGLDECDDASLRLLTTKFHKYFSSGHSIQSHRGLKLAIVSRRISGLAAFPQVKLDPDNDEHVSHDIQQFITASIQKLEKIPDFNKIRQKVETTLLERAQGTFLWVGFVVAELSKKQTRTGIEESLEDLPPGLDAIYSRMLLQAKRSWEAESTQPPVIREILCWVTMAVRPLKLQELTAAIAFSTVISDEQTIRDQITLCEPILKVQDLLVRLVHQSASDYFLREKLDDNRILEGYRVKAAEAHAEIARTCMDYIEKSNLCHKTLDIEDASVLQKSPLLNYAVLHWPEHAKCPSTHAERDYHLSRPLFQETSLVRINWWCAYRAVNQYGPLFKLISTQKSDDLPLLGLACYFGIDQLARNLLMEAWHIRFRKQLRKAGHLQFWNLQFRIFSGVRADMALTLAAGGGHMTIVQLLLTKGADINAENLWGGTVLIEAAEGGHEAIVQLLIAKGADVNATGGKALAKAAERGHEAIVQLLIAKGADVNATGGKALAKAAERGHEAIVQLLIAKGADVNATGGKALAKAAERGHEAIVQLLIAKGADVNATGGKALAKAAERGHEAIVQLLIAKGADVNATGGKALAKAAERGHEAIVQLLIAKGADVNATGGKALAKAAERGHEAIVQLLIAKGADVNATGGKALAKAAERGHEAIVQLLIAKGADVNATGGKALAKAAERGHEAIVQLLIAKGADVNATGGKALAKAAERGHEAIVQLLIAKGADVNATGGKALAKAAERGHEAIVQLLIAKGADVNATGGKALAKAAERGHEAIVQLLIAKGADINAGGGEALAGATLGGHEPIMQMLIAKGADINAGGGEVLAKAAFMGHEAIVQLLIANGADVNAKDMWGGTALKVAAGGGYKNIVQLLLSNGVNINARGGEALVMAASMGHEAIVQLLIANGADVNAGGLSGRTALRLATEKGHQTIVQLLESAGAC
ncbi:hypothetical protein PMG11_04384 [Penicillium brasilianum]|uniref:Uncharacterized protein n=1 Tax=Penicillium brasilianum TaxID=104259 RepID=A0A0F7VCL8_PENBI|nr:hypothetical protein PMG11_04384 [Penicillium brasilianum]